MKPVLPGLAGKRCDMFAPDRLRPSRTMAGLLCWSVVLWLLASAARATADDNASEGMAHFEAKIRPVLVQHCYKCHSTSSGKSEGGLQLDSRAGILQGGDRGPAVIPGKPEDSLLFAAIAHADADLRMPPKSDRLPKGVIDDFARWIRMGAPDPRTEPTGTTRPPVDVETGRKHWAYQPLASHPLPAIQDTTWPRQAIDYFILSRLEAAGLKPSSDAAAAVFIRRLYFDLIGLPPTPAQVTEFSQRVNSLGWDAAIAIESDGLLASPTFGERWGRHWLDVARFAESSGKEANISFPYAWRFRDYVLDSFNADIPFDRFTQEQIAGDLLPHESDAERTRLLVATGFLAIGPKNLDEANPVQFEADVIDEQIDAVSRAFLANSIACARCHDHKFDPYSMEDYYALAGIFASTKAHFGTFVSPANRIGGDPLRLPESVRTGIFHGGIPEPEVKKLQAELAALRREQEEGMAAVLKAVQAGEDPGEVFTIRDALRIFWRSGAIDGQLDKVDDSGRPLPLAMGVLDREKVGDAPLLERGEVGKPGQLIPRGFPEVISISDMPTLPANQSGRLELARWLTHPDNPLTARVFVNRVWHYLCGAGLVRSVDNFGLTGDSPSHPELLDRLTLDFTQHGWSVKQLVRTIVLSRAYRQASNYDEASFLADPDNKLLWRFSKRRLDAEAIRDAMLVVAEDMDSARPVGSLVARVIGDRPISLIGLDTRIPADLDASLHRSVYLPVLRDRLPDVLDLFDFAEPSLVTGSRETTNVPVQALYLMNSPFVRSRAASLASRLSPSNGPERLVQNAFEICLARAPDADELQIAKAYLGSEGRFEQLSADRREQVVIDFCQALLCTAEFRNLD